MNILLNGQPYMLRMDNPMLADVVDALDLPVQLMAVAVNRQVVRQADWRAYPIHPNDRVDIVRAIGGG